MNSFFTRLSGSSGVSRMSGELFAAFKQKNYSELKALVRTVAGMGNDEFLKCKEDGFTLLHHSVYH